MWYSVPFSQQRSLSSTSTSPPTLAALPWLPEEGLSIFSNSWQFRNAEPHGPSGHSQPSRGLSLYQGLSSHIPLLFPLQGGPSIVFFPVPPFCLGQNLWSKLWDVAAGQ